MRRALAVSVLLAGWLLAGAVGAGPAAAHAVVLATDPADGSRLGAAPEQVSVTFSESVTFGGGYLQVVDSKGRRADAGAVRHPGDDAAKISVGLRSGLPDDSYIVSYRVVSTDSHPIGGAFSFVVGDGPLVAATGLVLGGTSDPVVGAAFTATRWVSFAGLVLLGGLAFLLLCWPAGRAVPRARRLVWTGWGMTAAAAVLGVLLQGPYGAGSGLGQTFSPSLLAATLSTSYGRMLCVRLVLLAVLAVLTLRLLADEGVPDTTRSRHEDLTAIVGLGVLATYGGTGHAAAGSQPTLALLSDSAHLSAVSVWVGGLVLLTTCLLPTRRTGELAGALPRFSRIALGAVGVIVVTGTYQSWREVGTIPALWSTGYGRLLLAKIGCFLLLIGVAYLSRAAVRRRYLVPVAHALSTRDDVVATERSEEDRMLHRLRLSVGLEVTIAAAVLALASVLVSTAPARASYVHPYSATLTLAAGGTAELSVTPARSGANGVRVTVVDPAGAPRDVQDVTLSASLPTEQIGPLPLSLTRVGTGQFQSTGASLPRPGKWQFVVRVRTSEFDVSVAQADVPVR
jgi:copper transport protein